MQAQVEQLPENRVRLRVQVPSHDVHHAVEHAASDLAQTAKIPGFRKGKVPRQVLVQKVGKERLMTEAIESHIGGWFWNAAARSRVRPIAQPEYEFELPTGDDEDWEFRATFPVPAKPVLPDWKTLEVGAIEPEVPEELVQQELDDELARSASEFETLAELRADIESRLRDQIVDEAEARFRADVVDALVSASKVEASGPLVESRTRELLRGMARQVEARGVAFET